VIVQSGLPANNSGWRFRPNRPRLQISKTSQIVSDPVRGTANPLRIPGSFVDYLVTVTNLGAGTADANTVVITDPVPANTDLFVSSSGGPPITLTNGTPASGLSFAYPANVTFSIQPSGGAPYNYSPAVPNGFGVDPLIRGLRLAPTGTLAGSSAAGNPSFTMRFRVRVR
jgi:uncharacterized repeat protein (TIGR01451 family)